MESKTVADAILNFLLFFREKKDLALHEFCLLSRWFTSNVKPYFLKKIIIIPSDAVARASRVNMIDTTSKTKFHSVLKTKPHLRV